jgi:hypothetical protein
MRSFPAAATAPSAPTVALHLLNGGQYTVLQIGRSAEIGQSAAPNNDDLIAVAWPVNAGWEG